MEKVDAATLGQSAVRLGLLSEPQLQEALDEVGAREPDPALLLRSLERRGVLTPWQSAKLLRGESDGFRLGGYRILYKVASGSFGRVFRADDPASGRIVAIKVLRRRWTADANQVDLFIREGRVGMTLKHPAIVEMLAVNHDPGTNQYYMVMEFVEGGNLREILKIRKNLTVAETLRILEDATVGLAFAYSRGVTHRDIKLSNLLMSSQGTIKLVDFGLARLFATAKPDAEALEKVDRTVDYAGLEKATGVKPGDVRSDIYFLGCVGYHLLAGRSPLELTRSPSARMAKSRFDNVLPLKPHEAPPAVVQLIETMMSRDPSLRFQTPAQLEDAIKVARRDLDGHVPDKAEGKHGAAAPVASRSLFIVERITRLQTTLRDGFKDLGYRVFLSAEPQRALERFRQQPFDALLMDGATVGEECKTVFEQILGEARTRKLPCVGVMIVNEDQASWADKIAAAPNLAVMARPVTLNKLIAKLEELHDK